MQKESWNISQANEWEFTVDSDYSGWRLDRFLAEMLQEKSISRERIKKFISQEDVCVNGKVETSGKKALSFKSVVTMRVPSAATRLEATVGELEIIYQDANLAIVNKPAQLTMHPCPSCPEGTFVHLLLHHFEQLSALEGDRPGIVHRLDKDTTGLVLVALTEQSRLYFVEQFAKRTIFKEYIALVYGVPQDKTGEIDAPIGRHPQNKTMMAVTPTGKPAQSAWRVIYADPEGLFSLVAIKIYTGRTHQVRVHMAYIGHPLLGDEVYTRPAGEDGGKAARAALSPALLRRGVQTLEQQRKGGFAQAHQALAHFAVPRQMLHAWKLGFFHPQEDIKNMPQAVQQPSVMEALMSQCNPWKKEEEQEGTIFESHRPKRRLVEEEEVHSSAEAVPFGVLLPPPADFMHILEQLTAGFIPVVITGNPGCGKSTLLQTLQQMGHTTWSADAVVRELGQVGNDGWLLLKARYGDRFLLADDGALDKQKLGAAMEQDSALRKEIEQLLHPLVMHRLEVFWQECKAKGLPFAFAEVPLYFEVLQNSGPNAFGGDGYITPVTVGVHASFEHRQQRLQTTRNWSAERIALVEAWQMPEEQKMAAADIVLQNEEEAGVDWHDHVQKLAEDVLATLSSMQQAKSKSVMQLVL